MTSRRITREDVFSVADQLARAEENPTAPKIHGKLQRGSLSTIQKFLTEWRQRNDPTSHESRPFPQALASQANRLIEDIWAAALEAADLRSESIERDSYRRVELAQQDMRIEIKRSMEAEAKRAHAEHLARVANEKNRTQAEAISELLDALEVSEKRLAAIQADAAQWRAAEASFARQRDENAQAYAALEAKHTALKTENEALLSKVRETDSLVYKQNLAHEAHERRINHLEARLVEVQQAKNQLQEELDVERHAKTRLQDTLEIVRTENDKLRRDLTQSHEDCSDLRSSLKAAENQVANAQDVAEELKVINKEYQVAREAEAEHKGRLIAFREVYSAMERRLAIAERRIIELEGNYPDDA